MSPDKSPAAFMPETETANKLVISVLFSYGRISHDFQSLKCYFRHVIGRFTFVQLFFPLLKGIAPLFPSRSIPTPWKRSTVGWIENASSKTYSRDQPSLKGKYEFVCETSKSLFWLVAFIQYHILRWLSSHLKLWWINFKERNSYLSGRLLYLKVSWFIAGHTYNP